MIDIFLDLKTTLEKDLKSTGFSPDRKPPLEKEPKIEANLSRVETEGLKDLYDQYLIFYSYLTDQITRCIVFFEVTKARHVQKHAEAMKKAHTNKNLTNADLRKACVETDVIYLNAKRDFLYFKQMLAAHEERRRKMSKSMDRVGRELWFRTQSDSSAYHSGYSSNNEQVHEKFKHKYRKVGP
jgi:hypothetical protein